MNIFASRLRKMRLALDLRQQDIADELGVKQSTVYSWEKGINYPEVSKLLEIGEYFNVGMDYLLGLSDKKAVDAPAPPAQQLDKEHQDILNLWDSVAEEYRLNIRATMELFADKTQEDAANMPRRRNKIS